MKPRDLAAYGLLALIWGFSFLILVKAVPAYGWVGTTSFRSITAGLTLMALMRVTGRKLRLRAHVKGLLVVGATIVATQYIGLALAAPRIGTAMAAILVSTVPLFSMLISQAQGLERFSPQRLAGLLLGMMGIALLVGFPVMPFSLEFFFGVAMCVGGCIASAYGSVYASHALAKADAWSITAGSFLAGGLMVLPLLWFVPLPKVPETMDLLWLFLLGAVVSGLGYVLYFGLVASIGATRAVSVEFVVTVIAVIVGAAILGERLSPPQIVGAATVLIGCTLVLGLLPRRGA